MGWTVGIVVGCTICTWTGWTVALQWDSVRCTNTLVTLGLCCTMDICWQSWTCVHMAEMALIRLRKGLQEEYITFILQVDMVYPTYTILTNDVC